MRISSQTVEQIRTALQIEDVVGDFLTLKRKGQNLWACCPFHHEKTPSFSVTPLKGIFKCFGCGKAGDAITFLMELENISYTDALVYLAKKYNIEIIERKVSQTEEEQLAFQEQESLLIVMNFATQHYHSLLTKSQEGKAIGLSYFKERGFNLQTIEKYQLGYSPDSWDNLLQEAIKQGFSEAKLEKAGLLVIKEEQKKYDRFRGRVMFPIQNLVGKTIAFGARTLKKDDKPKYLNSPETEIYHKSEILYGIFQAKSEIRKKQNCYLVEGYTDVLSLAQAGIQNVVASSGTSLTEGQIRLLKRLTSQITVLYDGDAAGIRAALRGIDLILSEGMDVKVVLLPDGEDPDSYVRKQGGLALENFIDKNSKDFIRFKTEFFLQETAQDPLKKAQVITEIVGSIAKIPDAIKRQVFYQTCSNILGIEEEILRQEGSKITQKEQNKQKIDNFQHKKNEPLSPTTQEAESKKAHTPDKNILRQEEIVRLLVRYGQMELGNLRVCEYLLEEMDGIDFSKPAFRQIVEAFKHNTKTDADLLLQSQDPEVRYIVSDFLMEKHELSPNWEKKADVFVPNEVDLLGEVLLKKVLYVKLQILRNLFHQNLNKIKETESIEAQMELLAIQQKIKEDEMQIAKYLGNVIAKI
ncbi:DNA primase [Hugenholtzia roseola]|uniref:DNA primase n=1 Tax=Hugenholtzia roseola TaxID=1002 RepID=UPI00047991A6|nr:DNA primase [Hugenholtzia roseola]